MQRFAAWVEQRYLADLLGATTRDLLQYKTELGNRQKPASVNAALAPYAVSTGGRSMRSESYGNPARHLDRRRRSSARTEGFADVADHRAGAASDELPQVGLPITVGAAATDKQTERS
jgi:hypothetical protein